MGIEPESVWECLFPSNCCQGFWGGGIVQVRYPFNPLDAVCTTSTIAIMICPPFLDIKPESLAFRDSKRVVFLQRSQKNFPTRAAKNVGTK
jgi:hypothetical protein